MTYTYDASDRVVSAEEAAQSRAILILRNFDPVVWWELTYSGSYSTRERADIASLSGTANVGSYYQASYADAYEVKDWKSSCSRRPAR